MNETRDNPAISRRLLEMLENERNRIARELHDEIGQALTAVKIDLEMAATIDELPKLRAHLAESLSIVDRALQQVRNLSLDLRPSILDDLGLVAAIQWYLARIRVRSGLAVHFRQETVRPRFDRDIETTCFRLVQEATTNVVRHAEATEAVIELTETDKWLWLEIRDNGKGFDVETVLQQAARGESFGILGMKERVDIVQGRIRFDARSGEGTTIRVQIPIGPVEEVTLR
uniref:Oxygen sensor histidine kinase NreB n=1 Tax=Desulfatirhabdium butyrativorans TaxID=340467 RepID=A0A7C4RUA0_9BACT